MPKIPLLQRNRAIAAPRVVYRRQREQNINPDQFGAVLGQSITAAGKTISQVGELVDKRVTEMQDEKNSLDALNAFVATSEEMRQRLHEGDNAILAQRGHRAFDAYKNTQDAIVETVSRHRGALQSEDARATFDSLWSRRGESILETSARHVSRQRQVHRDATTKSLLAHSITIATDAALIDDGEGQTVINDSLERGKEVIIANSEGLPPTAVELALMEYESNLHKAVVERLMVKLPEMAEAYYKENQNDIHGAHHADLETKLKTQVRAVAGETLAELAFKDADNSEAAEKIIKNSGKSQPIQDEAMKRVEAKFARRKRDKLQRDDDLQEQAWELAHNNDEASITPEMKRALGGPALLRLEEYARRQKEPETNFKRYTELYEMGTKLLDVKMWAERPNLDNSDYQELVKHQARMRKSPADALTTTQLISAEIDELGLTGKNKSEERGRLRKLIGAELQKKTEKEGRELSQGEKRDVIREITTRAAYTASLWKIDYQTEKAPHEIADIDNVPPRDQAEIRERYKAVGRAPPTDQQIVEAFVQMLIHINRRKSGGQ